MSIEQTNDFHVVRRIVRVLAPDYRLFASNRIPENACVLDVAQKTLEVGESQDVFQAIGALLFQLGQLRLKSNPRYRLFFGDGIREWPGTPEALVDKLAHLGVKVDRLASRWAAAAFRMYWPDREDIHDDIVQQYTWDFGQWREYFNQR